MSQNWRSTDATYPLLHSPLHPRTKPQYFPPAAPSLPCTDFQSPLYEGSTFPVPGFDSPVRTFDFPYTRKRPSLYHHFFPYGLVEVSSSPLEYYGVSPHHKRIATIQVQHSIFPHSSFHSPSSPPSIDTMFKIFPQEITSQSCQSY